MLSQSVFLYQINARLSISVELASHAIMDTTLLVENANLHPLRRYLTSDAELGTGKTENVFNAPATSSSITLESAFPSPINARPSISAELASLATKDTTLLEEDANLLPSKLPVMLDVDCGIGIIENAFNAQTTGSSTIIEFAFLSLTNARPLMLLEPALLATKDTT